MHGRTTGYAWAIRSQPVNSARTTDGRATDNPWTPHRQSMCDGQPATNSLATNGYPTDNPQGIHERPVVAPLAIHGGPTGDQWTIHGRSKDNPSAIHERPTFNPRPTHQLPVGAPRTTHEQPTGDPRTTYRQCTEHPRTFITIRPTPTRSIFCGATCIQQCICNAVERVIASRYPPSHEVCTWALVSCSLSVRMPK